RSWPRCCNSRATPRRKCALPWFQSETSEWQKRTMRMSAGRRRRSWLPDRRQLAVEPPIIARHSRRRVAPRTPRRRRCQLFPTRAIGDELFDRAGDRTGIIGRHEDRRPAPQLAQRGDVAEDEGAATRRRFEDREAE